MISRMCLYFAFCMITSCGPANPSSSKTPAAVPTQEVEAQNYSLCGATTSTQRISEYFRQINVLLERSRDPDILRKLVADAVIIVEDGRSRSVSADDMVEQGLISTEDWAEISRRGEPRLISAGWRGCFLSHGKAFFEVDEDGHLRLASFDLDAAWDPAL